MPQAAFTLLEVVYSKRGGRKEASPIWDAHGKSCTQIRTYPWLLLEHHSVIQTLASGIPDPGVGDNP